MSLGLIAAMRCTGPCGKARSPRELIPVGDGGALICLDCYGWHLSALALLAGKKPPGGCQNCERTIEQLNPGGLDVEFRMYLHPVDGLYAVLCRTCSDRYERLTHMYRDTRYGWERKLK